MIRTAVRPRLERLRRVLWPRPRQPGRTSEDRATITRTFGYLLAAGALLLLLGRLLPDVPDRTPLEVGAPLLLAYLFTLLLLAGVEHVPQSLLHGAPVVGIVVLGVAAFHGGNVAIGAYAMFLFWVAIAASYLLPVRSALLSIVVAAFAYTVILEAESERPTLALLGATTLGGLAVAGVLLAALRVREHRVLAALETAARTDPLTGLVNRRGFEERFDEELARAQRDPRPLGLALIDLDRFKRVNDELGHEAGDGALVRAAEALRSSSRTPDIVARVGGEEFAVLLPETTLDQSLVAADRFRAAVDSEFEDWVIAITASCGVVAFPAHGVSKLDLMRSADGALYMAKAQGRALTMIGARGRVGGPISTLLSLAAEVDRRKGGEGDTWRPGLYAEAVSRAVGLSEEHAEQIGLAARLEDVGEIGIPEETLGSPQPLSRREWRLVQRHPAISARMVKNIGRCEAAEWISSHHERPDGSGYPRGLRGDEIPIEARILAVAGDFAALQSTRAYRPALAPDRAKAELVAGSGTRFDRALVEAFLGLGDDAPPAGVAAA